MRTAEERLALLHRRADLLKKKKELVLLKALGGVSGSLAVCLLAGGIYWLTLLAITALFFGGQYHGIAATGATILAGCGTICLLGIRSKKGSGRRQSRRRRQ